MRVDQLKSKLRTLNAEYKNLILNYRDIIDKLKQSRADKLEKRNEIKALREEIKREKQ